MSIRLPRTRVLRAAPRWRAESYRALHVSKQALIRLVSALRVALRHQDEPRQALVLPPPGWTLLRRRASREAWWRFVLRRVSLRPAPTQRASPACSPDRHPVRRDADE